MPIKFYLKKWTVSTIIIVESLITGGGGLPCDMSSAQHISNASNHDKRRYHRCHAYGRGAARKAEKSGKWQGAINPAMFAP